MGELFGEVTQRGAGVAVLDREGTCAVVTRCGDRNVESSSEGDLGEPVLGVDAHGACFVVVYLGLDIAKHPAGPKLGAVAVDVVQTTDPIVVGLGDSNGVGDLCGRVVGGSMTGERLGGDGLDLVQGNFWHGRTVVIDASKRRFSVCAPIGPVEGWTRPGRQGDSDLNRWCTSPATTMY